MIRASVSTSIPPRTLPAPVCRLLLVSPIDSLRPGWSPVTVDARQRILDPEVKGVGAAARLDDTDAIQADAAVVAEVLAGDTAAFAELASRHRRRIEHLCRR